MGRLSKKWATIGTLPLQSNLREGNITLTTIITILCQWRIEEMGNFKLFLQEQTTFSSSEGCFVKLVPDTISIKKISNFFPDLKLVDDLHCTLIYTDQPIQNVIFPDIDRHHRFAAEGVELDYWSGSDNEGFVVLKLKSESVRELQKKFADAIKRSGCDPLSAYQRKIMKMDGYIPHITLVTPAAGKENWMKKIQEENVKLKKYPLPLKMYYGGYVGNMKKSS